MNPNSNQVLILPLIDSDQRRLIHNYFEKHHPDVKKISLHCSAFPYQSRSFIKCTGCDQLVHMTHHDGYLANNVDQWYSGYCEECNEFISIDCYHNNTLISSTQNNCIVFGGCLKHVSKRKTCHSDLPSDEEVQEWLKAGIVLTVGQFPQSRVDIGNWIRASL